MVARKKSYPHYCNCHHHPPEMISNKDAANYHNNKRNKINMPHKRSSTSTTNASQSSSTTTIVGSKRKAAAPIDDLPADCSEELRLFFRNCDPKSTIFEARKSGIDFFNTSMQSKLSPKRIDYFL